MWTAIARPKYDRAGLRHVGDFREGEWRLLAPGIVNGGGCCPAPKFDPSKSNNINGLRPDQRRTLEPINTTTSGSNAYGGARD